MKVFVAGVLTETNTFAPAPTGMASFEQMGIRRGDGRGDSPSFDPAVRLLAALAAEEGYHVVSGLLAIAQPGGVVLKATYEALKDELLEGLEGAGPVGAVILLLHGAMVADGTPDCEGDLIETVRAVVGTDVPIGVQLDLHCHLSDRMVQCADLLVAYKEYPHTDVLDRLRELWRLTVDAASGRTTPVTAVVDCHMNGLWHTTREPMASFVRRMRAVEAQAGVLSVSLGHGFPWGDVAEAGAKLWVITDGDRNLAERYAADLASAFWGMRDATCAHSVALSAAIERLGGPASGGRPLVLADIADNPGGGANGDSTFILRALLDAQVGNVALGGLWDPMAVQACIEVGVATTFDLRIGGKSGKHAGLPVDLRVTVRAVDGDHRQRNLDGHLQTCGASAWVSTVDGLDLVLISLRQQVLGTDLFTGLGIDLRSKRAVVVKSQQHFHAAFAPIASEVLYVHTPGLLRSDVENIVYRYRDPDQWPRSRVPERWAMGRTVDFLP